MRAHFWSNAGVLEQQTEAKPDSATPPPSEASVAWSPRYIGRELYRLLPALAFAVAALTIAITLGQVLLGRAPSRPVPPPATAAASTPTVVEAVAPVVALPTATETAEPTTAPTVQAAITAVATATPPPLPTSTPLPPTATPLPPATMGLTLINFGRVRAQGRILTPDDRMDYWFLIREPGSDGVFRQGPTPLNAQGGFVFDLKLQSLSVGPDSVTLAAVPKDVSTAWTRESLRIGSWLPVVDVPAENGIVFLREVGL